MVPIDRILADPAFNGVYRLQPGTAVPPGVARLDAAALPDKDALLAALGACLALPDYYGANWDALEECLGEPSLGGVCLLIEGADRLDADALDVLLDIWRLAASQAAQEGRGMALLLSGSRRADLPLAG